MKWVLLSVAVFLGSIVVFVAIPRPALLRVANSLGVFGGGIVQVAAPTGSPQGAARDGGDSVETRTAGTFQADLVGRARVIDGDTIEVASARIRLFGVDAPESAQRCLAGSSRWSCGEQATRALAGRIDGRSVACEERDRDRYGRVVAVCRHGAQDVNAWLVREGWAMAYRRYSRDYVDEEAAARGAQRGLWRGEFVPPWDWRRGDRLKSASPGERVKATRDAPRVAARDGGGPEPRAHRLVLDVLAEQEQREVDGERDRALYIEAVAAIDLDAEAAPQIAQWLRERLQSGEPGERWVELLRDAFGGAWGFDPMPGAPAQLRALCATPETEHIAKALLSDRAEPPQTVEAVLELVRKLEERLAEKAWRRRRRAKMTADEPPPVEKC